MFIHLARREQNYFRSFLPNFNYCWSNRDVRFFARTWSKGVTDPFGLGLLLMLVEIAPTTTTTLVLRLMKTCFARRATRTAHSGSATATRAFRVNDVIGDDLALSWQRQCRSQIGQTTAHVDPSERIERGLLKTSSVEQLTVEETRAWWTRWARSAWSSREHHLLPTGWTWAYAWLRQNGWRHGNRRWTHWVGMRLRVRLR